MEPCNPDCEVPQAAILPGPWGPALEGLYEAVLGIAPDGRVRYLNRSARKILGLGQEAGFNENEAIDLDPETLIRVEGLPLSASASDAGGGSHLGERLAYHTEQSEGQPLRARLCRAGGLNFEVELSASRVANAGSVASLDADGWVLLVMRRLPESVRFAATEVNSLRTEPAASSERLYQLVFENAPLGILHFDPRGVITACNDHFVEVLGSSKTMLIGLDMLSLPNRQMAACVEQALAGQLSIYDGPYLSATGGRQRTLRVTFSPIEDEQAGSKGGVGIVEDVTESRSAQQSLALTDRMASLGTLAAGVAHEINNPLAYVFTSLETVHGYLAATPRDGVLSAGGSGEQDGTAEDMLRAIMRALDGAQRIAGIVSDLGSFSRPAVTSEVYTQIAEVLDSAVSLAWNELRHRALLVKNYGPPMRVCGEASKLVQVFLNLLLNAAQAMPDGDAEHNVVELRSSSEGGFAVVELRDTGTGIAPEVIDHLFEPFFTTKQVGEGTGLGLSICHGIVTSLGGEIRAQQNSSAGATVRVRLPLAEQGAREQRGTPDGGRSPSASTLARDPKVPRAVGRVLLIDDERHLGESLALALQPHQIIPVVSGVAGLDLLRRDRAFDLILCDLMIPDLSGPELFQQVEKEFPELLERFVFISGGAFTERTKAFVSSCKAPLLKKPFRLSQLEALIEEHLGVTKASWLKPKDTDGY